MKILYIFYGGETVKKTQTLKVKIPLGH